MTRLSLPVLLDGVDPELSHHAAALARLIEGEVRFDRHNRLLYSTDASIYQVEPLGVVIPTGEDDVERIVAYCRDHELPMLPRGGGTSLAGQCVNRAVVIDVSARLNTIGFISPATKACGVGAGMTIDDVNDQLRRFNLFFAPDPATARQANIGGVIGNNAAGTRSIVYGRTSENLEAVSVVLANGERVSFGPGDAAMSSLREVDLPVKVRSMLLDRREVVRHYTEGVIDIVTRYERLIRERFPKTVRRNAGYALDTMLAQIDEARARRILPFETMNLAQLICGSEGTLGVVTSAVLKLHPLPRGKGLAVIGFDSLDAAIAAVQPLLALKPSAIELLDDLIIDLARKNTEYRHYVELMPRPAGGALAAVLYVEFLCHSSSDELSERFDATRTLLMDIAPDAAVATYIEPVDVERALKLRKAGEPLLHAIPGARKPVGFVEDNAVPVERLGEFVREFRRIVESRGTIASFYAHASVGVLHVRPLLNLREAADRIAMEEIAVEVADLARSLGGVMSGEHGDGRARGPLLERYFGRELMRAFREVKRLFDPNNLLNPGNIIAPESIETIHETTRVRPRGGDLPEEQGVETYFSYSDEGAYEHAVELCNGAGVCRKKSGGTMCPSYMATLDERHSTRGRGNALRLAITGQFGDSNRPRWNDVGTLQTLDLCLSCKACKTECPSNVDVAKYKSEYLAQSYRAAGRVPLRALAIAHVRALSRIGSLTPEWVQGLAGTSAGRVILNRVLRLAPQRMAPRFTTSLFAQLKRRRSATARIGRSAPTVILYADCFTAYQEPWIGLATVEALETLGYRVLVPQIPCCGRAAISVGVLDHAQQTIHRAAESLHRIAQRESAVAIVVCEPSCLAAVKDDWLDLRVEAPSHAVRARLAAMSYLPEEFIEARWDEHPRQSATVANASDRSSRRVLLHGHCHQKALWGIETSAAPLRRIFGADRVTALDTGCCGMAGSFGYDRDHYDVSMKVGELRLFPEVSASDAETIIAAPGTSCRAQIHDGTRRIALHPIELIADALGLHDRGPGNQRLRR